jgi:hypothetical protein
MLWNDIPQRARVNLIRGWLRRPGIARYDGARLTQGMGEQAMKLFDVQHPFFVPLYRRVILVVLCLGWATFEFIAGSVGWGILFGALGLYCGYQFFVVFDPTPPKEPTPPDGDTKP